MVMAHVGLMGTGGDPARVRFRFSDPSYYGHNQRRMMSNDALDAFMRSKRVQVAIVNGKRWGRRQLEDGTQLLVIEL